LARLNAMALLEIRDLHVSHEETGKEIVKGVNLAVDLDQVHAVMGPNGSGKSTLAYALMGHPAYEITDGVILFEGENLVELGADERAQRGLFLAFQYPHAVPGVTVTNFLRSSINAIRKARAGQDDPIPIPEFRKDLLARMEELSVTRELAQRYINDGFSGGERKKMMGALVITHFPRVLNYIKADYVHVFADGRIVAEGGPELAQQLEADGYKAFIPEMEEATA
jgi:Fe-S cluster assembly ATP-binding protein